MRVLFLPPYAAPSIIDAQVTKWRALLEEYLKCRVRIVVSDLPFLTDNDINSKGYWLRPHAPTEDARKRLFRKQILNSMITVLAHVVRHQPRLIIGCGQGGLIASLAGLPLVLETACRARIVTDREMLAIRKS